MLVVLTRECCCRCRCDEWSVFTHHNVPQHAVDFYASCSASGHTVVNKRQSKVQCRMSRSARLDLHIEYSVLSHASTSTRHYPHQRVIWRSACAYVSHTYFLRPPHDKAQASCVCFFLFVGRFYCMCTLLRKASSKNQTENQECTQQ